MEAEREFNRPAGGLTAALAEGLAAAFADCGHEAARRLAARRPARLWRPHAQPPVRLPVVDWLAEAAENAAPEHAALAADLAAAADRLVWRQTYTRADFGDDFLSRYGWTALTGGPGPAAGEDVTAGFLLFGPGVEYPLHKHAAEEIYLVISGRASWNLDDGAGWTVKPAGAVLHNPPWRAHGMRTDQGAPLLLAFLWGAGELEKSVMTGG